MVLDPFNREVVGWTIKERMSAEIVTDAPTESYFNSLKNERVHGGDYRTREEARADVFEYIEMFYKYASYCPISLCA